MESDWQTMDKQLREPFPPDRIGLLPKPYKKDSEKGTCNVCGKWHGLPALHLDYVGHGAITERLLEVDPGWTWEPLAFEDGLPKITQRGGDLELWIRLTIGDRSKIGVGSCPANQFDAAKVLIGDALRNAAMRFGMALDLWIKGEGQENSEAPSKRPRSGPQKRTPTPPQSSESDVKATQTDLTPDVAAEVKRMKNWAFQQLGKDADKTKAIWEQVIGTYELNGGGLPNADSLGFIESDLSIAVGEALTAELVEK